MRKFVLFACLCFVSVCCIDAMRIVPRCVEGKVRLSAVAQKMPTLYLNGNLDQESFFDLICISNYALTAESRQKIVKAQENLDWPYLEMETPSKIKFLDNPDERERVIQIIQAIIERFNSELLGFSISSVSPFVSDTPLQRFEDLCIVYDIAQLATLDIVKSLKGYLSQQSEISSYPNVQCLLNLIR